MQPMISVIVPVYNTEKYLDKCISSIVNQTYKKIQIILVDDASTDSSKNICQNWQKKDKRICIIYNQKNKGAAFSKNRGIEVASGSYISFVDSDDWILSDMLEKMVSILQKYHADIIETPFFKIDSRIANKKYSLPNTTEMIEEMSTEKALKELMLNVKLHQTPCNKLYKRSVINNVRFPVGKYIDDEYWTYRVIANAEKVIYYDHYFYLYRQHPFSAMGKKFNIGRLDAVDALRERYIFIEKFFPQLSFYAYNSFLGQSFYLLQCLYLNTDIKDYALLGNKIVKIVKSIPINKRLLVLRKNNIKQRIWMLAFFTMPITTAKLRNKLKIGL